jgi:hypothetical protein
VFLNFCRDALEKIKDHSGAEAESLRDELELLVRRLERWAVTPNPPDKDRTIAAVMDAYRRALELAAKNARSAS